MTLKFASFLSLIGAFCFPLLSAKADQPIVAVFDVEFSRVDLPSGVGESLTDYLCSLLAGKGFQVVPRAKLNESLAEKKKDSYKQCFNQACQIEIGQELAAQKSLSTQVLKLGKECKVTLTLFDLKRSTSEKGATVSGGCDEDGIVKSMEKAVADMMGGGAQTAGAKAPDLGDYERIAATAAAEEAKQKEAEKKSLEERQKVQASLEKAWESVKKVAATRAMGQQARSGFVRKFLQDFPKDNPHEAEAKGWIASLDQGKEPFDHPPGNQEGMVKIPAGEFVMGCNPKVEKCVGGDVPAHKVWVSDFWMDKTEVSIAAHKKCVEAGKCTPAHFDDGACFVMISKHAEAKGKLPASFQGDHQPVVCVDWNQAKEYCEWIGKRLPTEAEWERAARGGTTGARYGNPLDVAWYYMNTSGFTGRVGKKQPNAFGLFDMLGNVWEWCSDWHAEDYYEDSPGRDPSGPETGKGKVYRGGAWNTETEYLLVHFRVGGSPDRPLDRAGFRCAGSAAIEK